MSEGTGTDAGGDAGGFDGGFDAGSYDFDSDTSAAVDAGSYDFDIGDGVESAAAEAANSAAADVVATYEGTVDGASYEVEAEADEHDTLNDADVVEALAQLRSGLDNDSVELVYVEPRLPDIAGDMRTVSPWDSPPPSERITRVYEHVRQVADLIARKNEPLFEKFSRSVLQWLSPSLAPPEDTPPTRPPEQRRSRIPAEPAQRRSRTVRQCPRCNGNGVVIDDG